ncbi:MAG: hypothetical protein A3J29_15765 [Acidobacteria bacterium RIFCSPLOWO2_12_FULL_67_14b]|nr:MAG: hypothetical protein A3J29_15765 [Acidobacteria bacterium RIFCSPLOWO2_12_FULL_67_14b]
MGTLQVSLSRSKVALGSPVEVTYKFTVAQNAPNLGARRVFVHFLDADEELMWTDDHDPPTPPAEWKPGQTIEYTRTMFVPSYPYVGAAQVVAGLYSEKDRLKLSNEDRGDRSYKVVDFELLPQTENIFVIFKDGWHPAEVVAEGAGRTEWQWTKKEATLAFRNPKRDVTLFLQVDNPATLPTAAATLTINVGDQLLTTVPLSAAESPVRKLAITAAQLGAGDMVELRFIADKTFVPALEPAMKSGDPRELGVRVFHAFVQ